MNSDFSRICFIGSGNMAEGILKAILSKKIIDSQSITLIDVSEERLDYLKAEYNVKVSLDCQKTLKEKVQSEGKSLPELVILAVKPQTFPHIASQIKGLLGDKILMSIVTGVTVKELTESLNHKVAIRVMPNTPALVGESMSMWKASFNVTPSQKQLACKILQAMGQHIEADNEEEIDMATALSGSGPAYVFLFVEALIDSGVRIGLSRAKAKKMTMQTLKGSLALLEKTDSHPAVLRNQVTSPGGTTASALFQLEEKGFSSAVSSAVYGAYVKSQELKERVKP